MKLIPNRAENVDVSYQCSCMLNRGSYEVGWLAQLARAKKLKAASSKVLFAQYAFNLMLILGKQDRFSPVPSQF